jgi:hypothetical protein
MVLQRYKYRFKKSNAFALSTGLALFVIFGYILITEEICIINAISHKEFE